jgi:pimeloyl-ACP methyl ester carboxylesterase
MSIQPFKIAIPQATLDDLRERLSRTRWPDEVEGAGWDYGTNLEYMKDLADYWQHEYDWRKHEAELNTFAHFKAEVDGLGIHFIHERGKGPRPMPIILTHGWPGSFCEMLKVIPRLTDPERHGGKAEDAFDVIVPSLPGYGFSDRPTQRGVTSARIAAMWARLMMKELGYQRFAAQGGDWGSVVTEQLAVAHPDVVLGFHLNNIPYHHLFAKADNLSQEEQTYLEVAGRWQFAEGAYAMIQGSKPQTLAYGLHDSPVGLAAWIVEKFRSWSDCAGDVEKRFTKDELLTTITLYWVTETINAANRLYYDSAHDFTSPQHTGRSAVPAAIARFPQDILPAPREWAFRRYGGTRTAGRGPTGILPPPPLIAPRSRLTTSQVWSRHSGRAAHSFAMRSCGDKTSPVRGPSLRSG